MLVSCSWQVFSLVGGNHHPEPPAVRWRNSNDDPFVAIVACDASTHHIFPFRGRAVVYLAGAGDKVSDPVLHSFQALIYGIFLFNLLVYNICAK